MKSLHAPWRIKYVLEKKPASGDTSEFTRIAQSQDDHDNYVITRSRHSFALLNKYPYAGGHVLVVPYRQVSDLDDLTNEENTDILKLLQCVKKAIQNSMNPDGFNIGLNLGRAAGAGIESHLHWHIVPRWVGDINFFPVIGQTNVLPEALEETAAKLRQAISNQCPA